MKKKRVRKNIKRKLQCPYCEGTGAMVLTYRSNRWVDRKTRKRAFELRKQGLTLECLIDSHFKDLARSSK